jgi:hypothetical protein
MISGKLTKIHGNFKKILIRCLQPMRKSVAQSTEIDEKVGLRQPTSLMKVVRLRLSCLADTQEPIHESEDEQCNTGEPE